MNKLHIPFSAHIPSSDTTIARQQLEMGRQWSVIRHNRRGFLQLAHLTATITFAVWDGSVFHHSGP